MTNLMCFIASHVTSKRLKYVAELFESIYEQTEKCPIYLSWSCDQECKNIMDQILQEVKSITGIYSDQKLSQFQHYKKLLLYAPENSYLMFSDDDDFWSENRIKHMKYALEKCLRKKGKVFSRIIFPDYTEFKNNGETRVNKFKTTVNRAEHWLTIVPDIVLKDFFDCTASWMISNSFCDVRFCDFSSLYKKGDITETITLSLGIPIYFYRLHDDGELMKNQKVKHKHSGTLKYIFDTQQFNLNINGLSWGLETAVISYYPDMERIKWEMISHFKCLPEESKERVEIGTYFNNIWPILTEWIHQTYNI